jgi:hypothetical protein
LVKLAKLSAILPAATKMVTPQERQHQVQQREAAFARRIGILRR